MCINRGGAKTRGIPGLNVLSKGITVASIDPTASIAEAYTGDGGNKEIK